MMVASPDHLLRYDEQDEEWQREEYEMPGAGGFLEFRLVGLQGPIVPYVRMTQRSKHADPRAQRYLASQQALKIQLRQQMAERNYEQLGREPLEVYLTFWWTNHRQDLDNLVKAVEDAASGIVWDDDRWVDRIEADRTQRRQQICFLQVRKVPSGGIIMPR